MIPKNKPTIPRPAKAEWYYEREGLGIGPVAEHQLRRAALEGHLKLDTLVWRVEFEDWRTASTVPAIVTILNEARRQSGIVHSPPAPERRSQSRSSVTARPTVADEATDASNVVSTAGRPDPAADGLHDAVSDEEAFENKVDASQVQEVLEHASRSGRWTQSSIMALAPTPKRRKLAVPLWIAATLAPIVLVLAGVVLLSRSP